MGCWLVNTGYVNFPRFFLLPLRSLDVCFFGVYYLVNLPHSCCFQSMAYRSSTIHSPYWNYFIGHSEYAINCFVNLFLFATSIGFFAYQMLIVLGYLFYLTGLFIIGRYLLQIQWKRIVLGWNSTNSIIHGALSISGLAAATTEIMPEEIIIGTWFLATVFLLLVEGISVIKGLYRLRIAGFTQGILVYDVSQWARVFTLECIIRLIFLS